jgi:hypothetical protein
MPPKREKGPKMTIKIAMKIARRRASCRAEHAKKSGAPQARENFQDGTMGCVPGIDT